MPADAPRPIADLLAALGDTPDEVAATLRQGGYRGLRGESCGCPVALYLRRNGWPTARVGIDAACPESDDRGRVPLPAAVERFVRLFDTRCDYQDLLQGMVRGRG